MIIFRKFLLLDVGGFPASSDLLKICSVFCHCSSCLSGVTMSDCDCDSDCIECCWDCCCDYCCDSDSDNKKKKKKEKVCFRWTDLCCTYCCCKCVCCGWFCCCDSCLEESEEEKPIKSPKGSNPSTINPVVSQPKPVKESDLEIEMQLLNATDKDLDNISHLPPPEIVVQTPGQLQKNS